MTLREDMVKMAEAARPKLLQMAEDQVLLARCFKEMQQVMFSKAPAYEISRLQFAYMSGAADFYAVQCYASELDFDEVTEQDIEFLNNVVREINKFHENIMALATLDNSKPQ